MSDDPYNADERFALKVNPDEALETVLEGRDVEVEMDEESLPDTISDPGVEGGVDAPNESTEEPDSQG